jgi:Flp pilus assembly protein CpaB
MKTRFGGHSPAHAYETKIRYVMASLFCIVLLLAGVLIQTLSSSSPNEAIARDTFIKDASASTFHSIELLSANSRIEEGAMFTNDNLTSISFPVDKIPDGALRLAEKDKILGLYATSLIPARMPIVTTNISNESPRTNLMIPEGMRAVTITLDEQQAVEFYSKPGSRVDVLFTFTDENKIKQIMTLVPFALVKSIRGIKEGETVGLKGPTTVTLQVSEMDAKRLELARSSGILSLALLGDKATPGSDHNSTITIEDITRKKGDTIPIEIPADGTFSVYNEKTGRTEIFSLRKNIWTKENT